MQLVHNYLSAATLLSHRCNCTVATPEAPQQLQAALKLAQRRCLHKLLHSHRRIPAPALARVPAPLHVLCQAPAVGSRCMVCGGAAGAGQERVISSRVRQHQHAVQVEPGAVSTCKHTSQRVFQQQLFQISAGLYALRHIASPSSIADATLCICHRATGNILDSLT